MLRYMLLLALSILLAPLSTLAAPDDDEVDAEGPAYEAAAAGYDSPEMAERARERARARGLPDQPLATPRPVDDEVMATADPPAPQGLADLGGDLEAGGDSTLAAIWDSLSQLWGRSRWYEVISSAALGLLGLVGLRAGARRLRSRRRGRLPIVSHAPEVDAVAQRRAEIGDAPRVRLATQQLDQLRSMLASPSTGTQGVSIDTLTEILDRFDRAYSQADVKFAAAVGSLGGARASWQREYQRALDDLRALVQPPAATPAPSTPVDPAAPQAPQAPQE